MTTLGTTTPSDKPLLLLVDDLPANLHLLVEILRDDYRIKTTTRGSDVLELAARMPLPDLILLDVMMPDMNGIEVLHLLRADRTTCTIPVVFVSADATEQTQLTGLSDGADDYLVKPVQSQVLLARVRNLLRRKRAEDALVQLNQELERKVEERTQTLAVALNRAEVANRAKNSFITVMSHELRSPMNGIISMVQICQETELDAEQCGYLEVAMQSADSLLVMIDDILNFSAIDSGNLETETIPFAVSDVLGKLTAEFDAEVRKKGLTQGVEVADAIPTTVLGDPARLRQVLHNLVGNAVKFTKSGTIDVRAEVAESGEQFVMLRFTVCDSGIGMSDEQIVQSFQPFTQADMSSSRKFSGIGLGLSISRLLVELMGGKITATSAPDQGTNISFTVCCQKAQETLYK